MIKQNIDNFEEDLKTIKQCNRILRDNWQDDNAEIYNTNISQNIEETTAAFISEIQSLNDEIMYAIEKVDESITKLRSIAHDIKEISLTPSIAGCHVVKVEGREIRDDILCTHYYVLKPNEAKYIDEQDYLEDKALLRCQDLTIIEDVKYYGPLA